VKKISIFILLVATAGIIQAQKNMHRVFGSEMKIIQGASKAILYLVNPTPMLSVDQVQGENYICDYPVVKSITLAKKNIKDLVVAALDTNTYLYGLNKKCPFMGKYAIQFYKGSKSVILLISTDPCDKVIIFCHGSAIDKKHLDLRDKGNLATLLNGLFGDIPTVPNHKE
jgi:hypothetical protein